MTLLIIALIVSALYAGLNYRNYFLLDNNAKAPVKPLYNPLKKGLDFMDWITIAVVLAVLFSCVTPMRSGYYTVKEVRGLNTIVLKEVQGDWHIPSDTLKVGDKVYLKRNKNDSLINVW